MNIFKWLFKNLLHKLSDNAGALYCDGVNGGAWKESVFGSTFGAITISFIITPFDVDAKSYKTWDQIITFNGNANAYYIRLDETGVPIASFFQGGSTWTRVTGTTALTDNVPVVITSTYNKNARSSIYINGMEDGYTTAPNTDIAGTTGWDFSIGGEAYRTTDVINSATSFYGLVEEYYVWATCLSADEVARLATKIRGIGRSIRTSSLYLYFPLDDYPDGTSTVGSYFHNHYKEVAGGQELLATTGSECRASVLVKSKSYIQFPRVGSGLMLVKPDPFSLELTLNSPSVTADQNVTPTPSALGLTLSLQSPTIEAIRNVTVTPDALTLSLSLQTPTISTVTNATPTPSTLTLALTLNSPTIEAIQNNTQTPSTLPLTLTLNAPTVVATQTRTVTPSTLTLALSLYDPSVSITGSATVTPSALDLTLTLNSPTYSIAELNIPATFELALTLLSPTIAITEIPDTLTLALSLLSPGISTSLHDTVFVDFQQLTLSLLDPTIEVREVPDVLALTLSLLQPAFVIYPHPVELTLTLLDPYIAYDYLLTGIEPLGLNLSLNDPRTDTGEFRKTKGPKRDPVEPISKRVLAESTNKIVNSAIY
jgi:hypothetical protein